MTCRQSQPLRRACVEVLSQRGSQRVEVGLARQGRDGGQVGRRTDGAMPAGQVAVPRHERHLDAAGEQVEGDVDAGQTGTDDDDPLGLAGDESAERARRPRVLDDGRRSFGGQQRRHRPRQRLGHRARRSTGRQGDAVGGEHPPVGEPDTGRLPRRQPHDLAVLEPHVGGGEDLAEVAAVGDAGREAVEGGDGVGVEPAAQVVGVVGPRRHPRRRDVQQVPGVGRAVGGAGARSARRVDDGDAGVRAAAPQLRGDQHARGPTPGDDDPWPRLGAWPARLDSRCDPRAPVRARLSAP